MSFQLRSTPRKKLIEQKPALLFILKNTHNRVFDEWNSNFVFPRYAINSSIAQILKALFSISFYKIQRSSSQEMLLPPFFLTAFAIVRIFSSYSHFTFTCEWVSTTEYFKCHLLLQSNKSFKDTQKLYFCKEHKCLFRSFWLLSWSSSAAFVKIIKYFWEIFMIMKKIFFIEFTQLEAQDLFF